MRTRIKIGILAMVVSTVCVGALPISAGAAPVVTSPIELYSNVPPFGGGMTSDPAGNIYLVNYHGGLYKIAANDPTGNYVRLASGTNFGSDENVTYFNGSLYVSSYSSPNDVWKVSLDGTSVQPYVVGGNSGPHPEGMAFDAAGTMYIADGDHNEIWAVPAGGGTPVVIAQGPSSGYPWEITVRGSTLYYVDNGTGNVMSVPTSGGVPVTVFADPTYLAPDSLTIDPAGNIFVTLGTRSGKGAGAILEIPAGSETPQVLNLPGLALPTYLYGGITWANGYVYFETGSGPGTLYRFADPVTPTPPLALTVERQPTMATGSWTGVASATSYTCSLLYGFGNLSGFTLEVTTNNCTFSGLDHSTVYGIQVTANNGGYSSSPTTGFAPLAKWSIICVNGKHTKTVTAVNPNCPAGYHVKR